LLVLIENFQGFKTFEFIWKLCWKLIKILYLFLEELLWERTSIRMLFSFYLIQTLFSFMQACLQKIVLQSLFYSI
jgi:hypothetical protein